MTRDERSVSILTCEERQALREAALRAGGRLEQGPWGLQTSNSFRRIGSCGDGDVLSAVVQRHDGQPDLLGAPGVLDYIIAAQPRVVLALLAALEAAEGSPQLGRPSEDEVIQLSVRRGELRRIVMCVRRHAATGPLCAEAEVLAFAAKLHAALGEGSGVAGELAYCEETTEWRDKG